MTRLLHWVKLPTAWIEDQGLREFRWAHGEGSANLAALMALTVISHHVDSESGIAELTYDELAAKTGLSRAKLSAGLKVLDMRNLVERQPEGRSTYRLGGYDPKKGWAQFPAAGLYRHETVAAFSNFQLRAPAELEALKLYFLFASRRDRHTNMAMISYDKIEEYSGVARSNIPRAVTLLGANSLVYVTQKPSRHVEDHYVNCYRLTHLNPRQHMGTFGRGTDVVEHDFG